LSREATYGYGPTHTTAQSTALGQGHAIPHLEEIFDIRRLYFLILGHIVPVAIFIILGMIATGAILMRLPDIYESRAVIQVEQQEKKVLKTEKVTDETPANVDFVNTVVQALTSRNILLRVVKANHLEKNPIFAPPRADGSPYTDNQLAMIMEKKVKVKLRRLTRLIDITVEDRDPELA
jgi:uncharacterized protein involved in exopolysaccharide biosynthesis